MRHPEPRRVDQKRVDVVEVLDRPDPVEDELDRLDALAVSGIEIGPLSEELDCLTLVRTFS
ncbi:MAG TPA: hypothetical protein VD789_07610, partial [Thermomicrobiales bacterium]|nr:hypothetical protein [Thermomicrobiales bacterium]